MKQALVVKSLIDRILLVRMDTGELLNLSVPCRSIQPGSMLIFDSDPDGCLIHSVNGKSCKSICHRKDYAMILEQGITDKFQVPLAQYKADRDVI